MEDVELLRCYVEERSEGAFAELVDRHLKLVYPLALRQVGGDPHLAQDVAQRVFTDLAVKANRLRHHRGLLGWLYTSTRYAAAQAVRSERRRAARDHFVYVMDEISASDQRQQSESIAPVVDEVLAELGARDREALLLRFFEGKTFVELGDALSMSPDAARMRVERALGRTEALLLKRGVTSTAVALAGILGVHSSMATPVGLAASLSGTALATAAVSGGVTGPIFFMTLSKAKLTLLSALIAGGAVTLVIQEQTNRALRRELKEAQSRLLPEQAVGARARVTAPSDTAAKTRATTEPTGPAPDSTVATPLKDPTAVKSAAGMAVAPASSTDLSAGMRPVEMLTNAGRGSPRAAFETQLWAAHGGDVEGEAKAIVLGPKARAKMEALMPTLPASLRSEYTTPEQMMAYVLAGSPRPVSAVQVLSESQQDPDTVILHAAWQHEGSAEVITNDVRFHRGAEGWQMVIPPSLVDRAANYLNNTPLPPPKPSGG